MAIVLSVDSHWACDRRVSSALGRRQRPAWTNCRTSGNRRADFVFDRDDRAGFCLTWPSAAMAGSSVETRRSAVVGLDGRGAGSELRPSGDHTGSASWRSHADRTDGNRADGVVDRHRPLRHSRLSRPSNQHRANCGSGTACRRHAPDSTRIAGRLPIVIAVYDRSLPSCCKLVRS